jgi:DNA repair photolyase
VAINQITAKSILNPTGGFLSSYTHTINPYIGCQLGLGLCGSYCYARAIAKGLRKDLRSWGKYLDAKINAAELYKKEYLNIKSRKIPLRIFMSSVTDPYVPVEKNLRITRKLLEAMTKMPPDCLVIQTHTPNVLWDLEILKDLNEACKLSVQISIETDMENSDLEKFYSYKWKHVYSVKSRLNALQKVRKNGIWSVATISPLLPLKNPDNFAQAIESSCDYAILDHFLLGDGSNGARTSSPVYFDEPLPKILEENGFGTWNTLSNFEEVRRIFEKIMGISRLGVSREGFNHILA